VRRGVDGIDVGIVIITSGMGVANQTSSRHRASSRGDGAEMRHRGAAYRRRVWKIARVKKSGVGRMGAGRQRRRHGGAISERRHRGSAQGDGGGENARSASNAVTSNARGISAKTLRRAGLSRLRSRLCGAHQRWRVTLAAYRRVVVNASGAWRMAYLKRIVTNQYRRHRQRGGR
jgi:hypothetical protein